MLFFDYELPERLIAQHPAAKRDESRLLVLDRSRQSLQHFHFRDLPRFLKEGDLLVLNDTKVLPARLLGKRSRTGGKWEGLFLKVTDGLWELLAQTRGFPQPGEQFEVIGSIPFALTLIDRTADRHWLMKPSRDEPPDAILQQVGHIPLPPYIRKGTAEDADSSRYQTVYAEHSGSVAAPTAGLHFTPELLEQLMQQGIQTASVTLHVGLGTFAPIKEPDPGQHAIHSEWCEVPEETATAIRETKQRGGRIIAVGTTTTRTLETTNGNAYRGESNLFLHPPYEFKVVGALITNFHLPRTTLLLLVQALSGSEFLRRAYEEAIAREYRFYSYGDAMLIV